MPRHASTHAAGVVITRDPATEYVPLSTNDGLPVTQFNILSGFAGEADCGRQARPLLNH